MLLCLCTCGLCKYKIGLSGWRKNNAYFGVFVFQGEGCHPPPVPGPPDHPHSRAGNKVIATFLSAIEFEDIM